MTEKELVAKMLDTLVKSRKELAGIDLGITKKSLPDLDKIIEHISAPLMIMVMGEFSTGKSTFINALVGEEIAAMNATPTTAVITKLCYGEEDKISVHFTDGTEKEYKKTAFKRLTSKTGKKNEDKTHESIEYVERQLPLDMLQYVTIIDSPGLNDINEQNSDTTKKFINNADTMFFMFSALKPVSKTEIDAMESLTPRLKPIAIINKMDAFDEEEESKEPEEFLDDIRVKLKDKVQAVVGISAKYALEGKLEKNEAKVEIGNLKELEKTVQELVLPNRDKFKLNTLMDELGEWLDTLSFDDIEEINQRNKEINYKEYIDLKRKIQQGRETLSNIAVEIKDFVRDEAKMYNEQALYILAIFYYQGILFTKDDEQAEQYLESAALKSHTRAQAALGGLYWEKKDIKKAKFWLEKAAKQNDKSALSCLGLLNLVGEKTNKEYFENGDYKKAIPFFEKAAALNEPFSNYYLFLCYWNGWGVNKDSDKAMEFLQKSAELRNETALVTLGEILVSRLDDSVSESNDNLSKAVECFTKAAENGNTKAIFSLGEIYRKYWKGDESDQKSLQYYKKAALLGNGDAQYWLGVYYGIGIGVKKDEEQAFAWYQKSAEQGNVDALNMLGRCYEEGWGVDKDKTKAVEWFKKGAGQGDATAQGNLARYYYKGEVVGQDYKEAFKWAEKAAEQDDTKAQYMLGVHYRYGHGVQQDEGKAFKYYLKAAEKGNKFAQFELATCFANGFGTKEDSIQALKWYQKAADQGENRAQFNLGYCYETGRGTDLDINKAIFWYRKAAEQGNENAKNRAVELEEKKKNEDDKKIIADLEGNQNVKSICEKENLDKDTCAGKWEKKTDSEVYNEAIQGNCDAQYELAKRYQNGYGGERNNSQAFYWCHKAADQGLGLAQYTLATFYEKGIGVTINTSQAIYYYKKAAEKGYQKAKLELNRLQNQKDNFSDFEKLKKCAGQGNVAAQYELGNRYYRGEDIPQDYQQAVYWFRKAAEQGDFNAQNMLGHCNAEGKGLEQDYQQAIFWYKKAADKGHQNAKQELTRLQNEEKARLEVIELWYKEATGGSADAQYHLATAYYLGKLVPKNLKLAFDYYKKSAEQGNENAQSMLGRCYEEGWGTEVNIPQALYWHIKAAEQGNADSKNRLENYYRTKGSGGSKQTTNNGKKESHAGLGFGIIIIGLILLFVVPPLGIALLGWCGYNFYKGLKS